ncbi:hypothetical protein [Sphingomonas sp. MMS24-J13]|uniref:hypothetical protein n=1 Tax=Sphingomonas sp. MMS24-J13 TaxID=3238686 RepID=UPI0038511D0F
MKSEGLSGIAIVVSALWVPGLAAQVTPPPPVPKPDFAKVRATGEASLKAPLFDPVSAQIVYTSGFQWGYAKPLIGKRTWGWIACGTLNAKNRMGGYVGAQGFWILSDANGTISWGNALESVTTCDTGAKVELQPELRDQNGRRCGGECQARHR